MAALGITLLLHVTLWRLLGAPLPPRAPPQAPVRVTILRLQSPPVPATSVPLANAPGTRFEPPRSKPRNEREGPARAAPSHPVPVSAEPLSAEAAVGPPGAAASAAWPSLLDSPATRRAILEAARQPSLRELGDVPSSPGQRLGNAIADSATGDCLKGEFTGGGMGLLSLPFWALAQLREQCAK